MIYRFEIDLEADNDEEAKKELEARIIEMAEAIEGWKEGEEVFEPSAYGLFHPIQ